MDVNETNDGLPSILEDQNAAIDRQGVQPVDPTQDALRDPIHPEGSASRPNPRPSHPAHSEHEGDGPHTVEDIVSAHLASVLAVIPDVQPEHALGLINQQLASEGAANHAVEAVINQLFDSAYPKVEKKKRKRDSEDSTQGPDATSEKGKMVAKDEKKGRIDWLSLERQCPPGPYVILALDQLSQDFRYISKSHVRDVFSSNNHLYYPSYFQLRTVDNTSRFWKKVPTPRPKGKGRFKSEEFDVERQAVLDAVAAEQEPGFLPGNDQVSGLSSSAQSSRIEEEEEEVEGGIECGCCFSAYAFENMIQCPDAHLFCKTCARRTAEEAIGGRKAMIKCMDQDGCQLEFSVSEIKRFLDSKAFGLLEKIKAERALTDACLEGLEECPFCDFKCIIENDQERLFRCENDECGIDHLPRSCAEVVDDRNLDARHAVEEAMTEALMRKCPKCSKAFIKENGCNKMRCPYCQALSCYVCRQIISGYEHFNQQPGQAAGSKSKSKKCPLWDDLDKRHHDEVAEAARRAAREQEIANPEINPDQLKVDLPPAPPNRAENPAPAQGFPIPAGFAGGLFGLNPLVPPPQPAAANPINEFQHHVARIEREAQHPRRIVVPPRRARRDELLALVEQQNAELRRVREDLERQRNEVVALQRAGGHGMNPFGGPVNQAPFENAGFGPRARHPAPALFGAPPMQNPPERAGNPFILQPGWFHPVAPAAGAHVYENGGPQPAQRQ
ncbi:hypothetical protein FRC05_008832 [Tulasnella sp. 425]|nr:hypothetical protein FRC05_008832 [Tulasnella sp. 425]